MRRSARLALPVAMVLTIVCGVARADELLSEPTSTSDPRREWYGWQTLAADAAVAATWIAADRTGSGQLAGLGALGYLVGTPLIHGLHGRTPTALVSVLLRLTAPIVGGFTGYLLGSTGCAPSSEAPTNDVGGPVSACADDGAVIGFFGAMVGVAIFDAARATTTPGAVEWHPHRDPPLAFTPTIAPARDGATFGLVGRF